MHILRRLLNPFRPWLPHWVIKKVFWRKINVRLDDTKPWLP